MQFSTVCFFWDRVYVKDIPVYSIPCTLTISWFMLWLCQEFKNLFWLSLVFSVYVESMSLSLHKIVNTWIVLCVIFTTLTDINSLQISSNLCLLSWYLRWFALIWPLTSTLTPALWANEGFFTQNLTQISRSNHLGYILKWVFSLVPRRMIISTNPSPKT